MKGVFKSLFAVLLMAAFCLAFTPVDVTESPPDVQTEMTVNLQVDFDQSVQAEIPEFEQVYLFRSHFEPAVNPKTDNQASGSHNFYQPEAIQYQEPLITEDKYRHRHPLKV